MPITVSMIEEKEFKIKMRGYDPVEVDEMLDEICDEMVAMQEEINTLQSRLNQAQAAQNTFAPAAVPVPAPVPAPAAPAPVFVRQEPAEDDAAQRLLARAQKFYDQTVAEAQEKANEILKNAEKRADSGITALEDEKAALQEEIDMLKAAARDYRNRFVNLLKDQQHLLNTENELFQ